MIVRQFGEAGGKVVIDKRWEGIEQAAWTVLLGEGQD